MSESILPPTPSGECNVSLTPTYPRRGARQPSIYLSCPCLHPLRPRGDGGWRVSRLVRCGWRRHRARCTNEQAPTRARTDMLAMS
eukprot:6174888-Pleurochrysis_carterae.AAC.1